MDETNGEAVISWTPARQKLCSLLEDVHPDAAVLYSQAVDALRAEPRSWPMLMIGSHCIRELVPTVVSAQRLPIPDRADNSKTSKALAQAWSRYDLGFQADATDAKMSDDERRAVPNAVYIAAREAAEAGGRATRNSRTITALLATGHDNDIDAASLQRLHDAIGRFRGWPHHLDYTKPPLDIPPASEISRLLCVLEEALLTRFENRGDRVTNLRTQLKRINERGGEAGHE